MSLTFTCSMAILISFNLSSCFSNFCISYDNTALGDLALYCLFYKNFLTQEKNKFDFQLAWKYPRIQIFK